MAGAYGLPRVAHVLQEDPFVSTDELANEIVKVRSERFDRALNHVLKLVGDKAPETDGVMAKVSKATSQERTKVTCAENPFCATA